MIEFFKALISIFDNVNNATRLEKKCPNCRSTIGDIINMARLGCGNCYDYFHKEIIQIISKTQYKTTHEGKCINKKSLKTLELSKDQLEEQLKECIKFEKYEEAKIIKDKIDKLN